MLLAGIHELILCLSKSLGMLPLVSTRAGACIVFLFPHLTQVAVTGYF